METDSLASHHFVRIPLDDPRYPPLLRQIADPPSVLWMRGDLSVCTAPAVAIVGSRAASQYARETAARLASDLAALGIVVVSGLARGVDSAAHRGALTKGRTLAVFGSGIDIVYPPEHGDLAGEIARAGLLVSELPPGTRPRPGHFPRRNRIISGLSLAVVVIEASDRSGSLITARLALDQGRDVMAVPGNVLSGRNRGAHALLKDGAKLVEHVDDILDELPLSRALVHQRPSCCNSLKTDELMALMEEGESYDLDALAERSGLPAPALLARLLDLELAGRVARAEGGRFVRSGRKC